MDDPVEPAAAPVFISYATTDRKQALALCKALNRRGIRSWIACRDVLPGENYQEAIVRALRAAPAVVLIFSAAANTSDEIKKELSLASRYQRPVIALRIADVEPSDAFAYELSTRQWIDAFAGWDRATNTLAAAISNSREAVVPAVKSGRSPSTRWHRPALVGAAVALLILLAWGGWRWFQPPAAAAHSMTVRLAGFRPLSSDLPLNMHDALQSEINTAFNADGVVGVSLAAAAPAGSEPAYALGGTIQRDGDVIRVVTNLVDEHAGTTLWSKSFDYPAARAQKVPRLVAVDAGNVVRCGLFGASTYRRPLPDPVLKDYLQFCQGHWDPDMSAGRKALVPAQRVVAAVPDFSWGWAGVAGGYWKVAMQTDDPRVASQAKAQGVAAADRALAIDPKNSEAMWIKSLLIDEHDWLAREQLLKKAVASMRLDCGCEHHQYGEMLLSVGRISAAVDQLRQADDMLALYVYTALGLADALVVAGKPDEAKPHFDEAIQLSPDVGLGKWIAMSAATGGGDDRAIIQALLDPELTIAPQQRSALLAGYRALELRNDAAGKDAARLLMALPEAQENEQVALLLARLGFTQDAASVARRIVLSGSTQFLWQPAMRAVLADPAWVPVFRQIGLINYWKASRTRPDICSAGSPPSFCQVI